LKTNWKLWALVATALVGLQPFQAQAQALPGEQTEGSLLVETAPLDCLWEMTPAEAEAHREVPGECLVESDVPPLPPIYVSVSGGYYEQVPVVVEEPLPPAVRRRRVLSSRGPQSSFSSAPVQRKTVYRSVYRRQQRQLNITPIIEKYAQKFNLDPWLLRGVIEVESAFRPHATSYAGAGGLMQLMPGTASYLGCRDRYDPEQNIAAGARYLRQMLNRFDQNYDLAIAAYNAGPGNVARYGGIPPFAETQNYVRKVRRAWSKRPQQ
jgi:soluble lytic murein transglycosylase-like protein